MKQTRRDFLKFSGILGGTGLISLTGAFGAFKLINVANAEENKGFSFAYISDSHLIVKAGYQKEHRFIRALKKAVEDINALNPPPDFLLYGGDLAQLGQKEELEVGKDILSGLKIKTYMMVGEHDWYYDLGEKWTEFFGKPWYSFDHKGVHFIVLNSVLVEDYWTEKKMNQMERMLFMAQLDNPDGKPFTVGRGYLGDEQTRWLKDDLARVPKSTPIVVFSHSPLYKYYKSWNFWTDDADEIQKILSPYRTVTVIHGHTHQVLVNRIKNITFYGMLSTAWPWPYAPQGVPKLTREMERADPFNQFDACGVGQVNLSSAGEADKIYNLWDREPLVFRYQEIKKDKLPAPPDALHLSY